MSYFKIFCSGYFNLLLKLKYYLKAVFQSVLGLFFENLINCSNFLLLSKFYN